jgi:phage shock protein A
LYAIDHYFPIQQDALQEKKLQVQQMEQRIAKLEEQLSVVHQAAASQLTQHQVTTAVLALADTAPGNCSGPGTS